MGMGIIYQFCLAVSAGVVLGFLGGAIKAICRKKGYSQQQVTQARKALARAARVAKYLTFLGLALGLIWCVYFLVLGAVSPGQAEYANNMSELIVAVLTVISIVFAFLEFLKHADG